ncbi:MAG: hypothetical protein LLF76_06125 [Planctomycetaceae bacterium]|nr:hypothetical protein [Planctomycetaceae bacterium]
MDIASGWGNKQTEAFLKSVGGAKTQNGACGIAHLGSEEMSELIAEIDSGKYLKFHEAGGNSSSPELTVYLSGEKGILPEGQAVTINYEQKKNGCLANNIFCRRRRSDTGQAVSDWINKDDYLLELKFAAETDGFLLGRITVEYPKANIRLKTEFRAKIKGLRLVDGHPDLRSDSMETLCYATKLYLEEKYNEKDLNVQQAEGNYSAWYNNEAPGRMQAGGIDVYYEHNGEKTFLRTHLHKKDGTWSVAGELRGDQFFAAHPLQEPEKADIKEHLKVLAYRRLEQDLQQEKPGGIFRSVSFAPVRRSKKMAQVTVDYCEAGNDADSKRTYLLEFADGNWQVLRQLADNEKLNVKTNTVEKTER